MTNQDKKIWLKRYTNLDKSINQRIEEIERIKAMCTRMVTAFTDLPKSPGIKSREELYIKLADMADEINADVDIYVDMRTEIVSAINTVDDGTLRRLLMYKYIDGLSWSDVALKMQYDVSWITRLHGKALSMVQINKH